jgi:hypothetical protein
MVTIRTVQNIKLGAKITFVNGIYAIICAILYFIFFEFLMTINFSKIEGASWGFFDKFNPAIGSLFFRLFLLVALVIIAMGAAIMYLSYNIMKKKEKDLWVVLFIVGMIFWTGLFTIETLNKNYYTMIFSFIGWLSFIIGMLIPIKYYLEKPYTEY